MWRPFWQKLRSEPEPPRLQGRRTYLLRVQNFSHASLFDASVPSATSSGNRVGFAVAIQVAEGTSGAGKRAWSVGSTGASRCRGTRRVWAAIGQRVPTCMVILYRGVDESDDARMMSRAGRG